MVVAMDGAEETIVGIPALDDLDPALREAGNEAWKLRAVARDTGELLFRYGDAGPDERDQVREEVHTAVTSTLPEQLDTFTGMYEAGAMQFRYSATGMHESLDNPDRVAQQALRRYHADTAAMLEWVDALAEHHLGVSLRDHAPMEGLDDRFRLEQDDSWTVAGGWQDELDRYTDAYGDVDTGWDDDPYGYFDTYGF